MAELTFKSAGVSTREIDLSGPTAVRPQGVPAGVIGTAQKGPAFVPITVATFADFVADFGGTDGKKFGPLAMNEWMRNARAGTYVRVLGVGDAKKRSDKGRVKNAGFVVGAQLPQDTSVHDGGGLGKNAYAFGNGVGDQLDGRTFFLGALMRETYVASGESSASARLTMATPLDPVELATSDARGEAVRFTDAAGETATIWVHEGADRLSSAGMPAATNDLATLENSKNVFVNAGSRGTCVISVDSADPNDFDKKMIELTGTDLADKYIATFDATVLPAGTDATTIGINGLASAPDIAAQLKASIDAAMALAPDAFFTTSIDGNEVTLQTVEFGNPKDEPDGGAFLSGHLSTKNAAGVATDRTNLEAWGGDDPGVDVLIDRIISAAAGLGAALTFSRDGANVLVVTQDTAGETGNFGVGSAGISIDGEHAVHTLTVGNDGADFNDGDQVQVVDLAGNMLGITFVDSGDADAASNQVSVGDADAAIAEFVQQGADPKFLDSDVVELTNTAGVVLTINFANNGGAGDLLTLVDGDPAGGTMEITVDCQHPDHVSQDAITTLAAAINECREENSGVAPGFDVVAEVNPDADNVNELRLTQEVAGDAGNTAISITGPTDAGDWLSLASDFAGGRDEPLAADIAEDIRDLIFDSSLEVAVERDGAEITITQQEGGEHLLASCIIQSVGTAIDDGDIAIAESDAGSDFEDYDAGVASPFAAATTAGTAVAGLTDSLLNFAGGETGIEEAEHTHWADAGIDTSSAAQPIIRAVIMTPAGVHASLRSLLTDRIDAAAGSSVAATAEPTGVDKSGGSQLGLVQVSSSQQRFTVLLNGHTDSDAHPSELRCSFDPQAPDYFMNVLNSDAACLEKAGHCVYAHYDVYNSYAGISTEGRDAGTITGPDAAAGIASGEVAAAFLVHGQQAPGALNAGADADGDLTMPNYEDFQDRFATAKSPWVISQIYGAKPKNLFKIHALDDGIAGSGKFKITISNIMKGAGDTHGKFDLFVRDISDDDIDPRVYEKFIGIDLNPNSDRYIARVVGDQYMYYDFDKRPGSQKLVVEGIHPQRSKYIRVEMAPEVSAGAMPSSALPLGYRGYSHLVTSLNNDTDAVHYLQSGLTNLNSLSATPAGAGEGTFINDAIEPPVPMRMSISQGSGNKKRPNASLCWGTMFQVADNLDEANNSVKFNPTILSHCKYFPTFRADSQPKVAAGDNAGVKPPVDSITGSVVGAELDSDKFNNNMFSLERIQVITKNPDAVQPANPQVRGEVDHKQWAVAEYRRDGLLKAEADTLTLEGMAVNDPSSTSGRRFLDPKVDLASSTTRRYMKFSFFLQGGFDGANIFDSEKAQLTNRAAVWEMDDADQGGVTGSTVAAFRKAIDVMAEKADVDIKLLAVPGMRDESITDYAIDAVEDRFDAMYIMDIEEKSVAGNLMVDYSSQKPSVNLTVEELKGRNLDSSFAAAYFPDVVITDPALGTNVQCPPSVAVLGAFSLNDSVAHPWFAPAGFSRGALTSVVETQVKLSRANLDALYESDINPLAAFPHTPGVVVWGQKTLQQAQSALDRVNVRRLLIEIRREVRRVGNNLLFEPNREETLGRFSAAVNPILQRIQQQQGLDKFKVVIDTTTTTQADIENNTVRGKIFLQPTRTVEFISLDFVVTNAGMEV